MLETTIYNLLSADTTIEGIVGEKIYPLLASEKDITPYLVYQVLTDTRDYTLSSQSGIANASVQISCWEDSYYNVLTLKNAVLNCLDNYSDKDNPSSSDDTFIEWIMLDDISDLVDYTENVDNRKYGKRIVFRVWYQI